MKQVAEWKKWALLAVGNAIVWSILAVTFNDRTSFVVGGAFAVICTGRAVRSYRHQR